MFSERSRELETFLSQDEVRGMTVLLNPDDFANAGEGRLAEQLRAEAPPDEVKRLQRNILAKITSLHWAYSDLGPEDHELVGPDAWDLLLYRLAHGRGHDDRPDDAVPAAKPAVQSL